MIRTRWRIRITIRHPKIPYRRQSPNGSITQWSIYQSKSVERMKVKDLGGPMTSSTPSIMSTPKGDVL